MGVTLSDGGFAEIAGFILGVSMKFGVGHSVFIVEAKVKASNVDPGSSGLKMRLIRLESCGWLWERFLRPNFMGHPYNAF